MHVADVDQSVVDSRVGAMHTVDPFHTFMFDSEGTLLNANGSALEAFARHATGDVLAHIESLQAQQALQAWKPMSADSAVQLLLISAVAARCCSNDSSPCTAEVSFV